MKFLITCLILCFFSFAQALAEPVEYSDAKLSIKNGDTDAAFMNYLLLSRQKEKSTYHQDALFATAEYYFSIHDFNDAFDTFRNFLEAYPGSSLKPIALFYLLNISRYWHLEKLIKEIEKEILNLKRIVLVFKENQEYKIKSPMGRFYAVKYYIDRVEFHINGKLQEQILF